MERSSSVRGRVGMLRTADEARLGENRRAPKRRGVEAGDGAILMVENEDVDVDVTEVNEMSDSTLSTPTAPCRPSAPTLRSAEEITAATAASATLHDGLWMSEDTLSWYVVAKEKIATSNGAVHSLKERTVNGAAIWRSRYSWKRPEHQTFIEKNAKVVIPMVTDFTKTLASYSEKHIKLQGKEAVVVSTERKKATLECDGQRLSLEYRAFDAAYGRRCYEGCVLTAHIAKHHTYGCDSCALTAPKESPMLQCQQHDYDLCMRCCGYFTDVNNCRVVRGPTHPHSASLPKPGACTALYTNNTLSGYQVIWEGGKTEVFRAPPFQDIVPVYGGDVCLMAKVALLSHNCAEYNKEIGLRLLRTSECYEISEDGKEARCVRDTPASLVTKELLETRWGVPVFHVEIGEVTGRISVGLFLELAEEYDSHIGSAERSVALTSSGETAAVYNAGSLSTQAVPAFKKGDIVSMRIHQVQERGRSELVFFVNGESVKGGILNFSGKFRYGVAMDSAGSSVSVNSGSTIKSPSFEILARTQPYKGDYHHMALSPNINVTEEGKLASKENGEGSTTVITAEIFTPEAHQATCSYKIESCTYPFAFGITGRFLENMDEGLLLGDTLMEGTVGVQCTEDGVFMVEDGAKELLKDVVIGAGDVVAVGPHEGRIGFQLNGIVIVSVYVNPAVRGANRMAVSLSAGTSIRILKTGEREMIKLALSALLQKHNAVSSSESGAIVTLTESYNPEKGFTFMDLLPGVTISEEGKSAANNSGARCTTITRQVIKVGESVLCNFHVKALVYPVVIGVAGMHPTGTVNSVLGQKNFDHTLAFVCTADGCFISGDGVQKKVSEKVVKVGDDLTLGLTTSGAIIFYCNSAITHMGCTIVGNFRFAVSLCAQGACLQLTAAPETTKLAHSIAHNSRALAAPESDAKKRIREATQDYNASIGYTFMDFLKGVELEGEKRARQRNPGVHTVVTREVTNTAAGSALCTFKIGVAKFPLCLGFTEEYPEDLERPAANKRDQIVGVLFTEEGCFFTTRGRTRTITEEAVKSGDVITLGFSSGQVLVAINGRVSGAGLSIEGKFRFSITLAEVGAEVEIVGCDEATKTAFSAAGAQMAQGERQSANTFEDHLQNVDISDSGTTATATATQPCTVLTSHHIAEGSNGHCVFRINSLRHPITFGVTEASPIPIVLAAQMIGAPGFAHTLGLLCCEDGCYLVNNGTRMKVSVLEPVKEGDIVAVHVTENNLVLFDIQGKKLVDETAHVKNGCRIGVSMMCEGTQVAVLDGGDEEEEGDLLCWDDIAMDEAVKIEGAHDVYKSTLFGMDVAVKVLRARSRDAVQREVSTMQSISHPNVITTHGYVRSPTGGYAVITKLLPHNLISFMTTSPQIETRINVILSLCRGMALFARRYVHGALKPTNVFVTEDLKGIVGERTIIDETMSDTNDPQTYLAPEVAEGGSPTEASDVYSMGLLLRYVETGGNMDLERLSEEAGEEDKSARFSETLASMPEVDTRIAEVVALCVDKDPKNRPAFSGLCMMLEHVVKMYNKMED